MPVWRDRSACHLWHRPAGRRRGKTGLPATAGRPCDTEKRSAIVSRMEPVENEPVRVSRGVRNLLALLGVLLLVPSLATIAWALWNHAEPRGILTIVPGGFLLGLILIVFAIRTGK
jgi:hypothetical protein